MLSREEFYHEFASIEVAQRAVEGYERMGMDVDTLAPIKARIALESVLRRLRPLLGS